MFRVYLFLVFNHFGLNVVSCRVPYFKLHFVLIFVFMSNCCYVFSYFYYVFILYFITCFIMFSFRIFYCSFHISHFVLLLYFHFVFLLCVLLCFHFIFYVFILFTLGSRPITQISDPLQPKFLGPIWPKTKAFFTGLKPTKEASLVQGQAGPLPASCSSFSFLSRHTRGPVA